jgi:YegS/Rv2252/BmrU family lipid kinase
MNPVAGTRRRVRASVVGALEGAGVGYTFFETTHSGHAFELACVAVEQASDLVLAIGGDGTVNEVGRALVGSSIPLGVVPVGSGNAFARALGISLKPERAVVQALTSQVKALDVGTVGDMIFLSTAGIGLDADVAFRYGRRTNKRRGLLPYLMVTAQALMAFRSVPVRLVLDETDEYDVCPLLVTVANTAQFGNGAIIAPGAVPNDGILSVCVIEDNRRLETVLNAWRLFHGSIDRLPNVRLYEAHTVCIKRATPGGFQADGEACDGPAQLDFGVRPGALRVAWPAD